MKKYKVFSTIIDPDRSVFLSGELAELLEYIQKENFVTERIDCHTVDGWSYNKQRSIQCLQYIIIASYESEEKDE